jgi:hypothetical protein
MLVLILVVDFNVQIYKNRGGDCFSDRTATNMYLVNLVHCTQDTVSANHNNTAHANVWALCMKQNIYASKWYWIFLENENEWKKLTAIKITLHYEYFRLFYNVN